MAFNGLILDAMLGKLCRNLRILGFDAEYHRESDEELIYKAVTESRIPVTKDGLLAARRIFREKNIPVIVPRSSNHFLQLIDVLSELNLLGNPVKPGKSRCPLCNRALLKLKPISSAGNVPAFVWINKGRDVRICPLCLKTYWKGTHYTNFFRQLNEITGNCETM
jgi:hypothetical protein